MKILTGRLRGRRIEFKPNPSLRPTADKVRQAVFNILQAKTKGAKVLDLYSGTGALGMEALSSGATSAIFVENDSLQCQKIRRSLEALGLTAFAEVKCSEALKVIQEFSKNGERFDIIFLDPPYERDLAVKTLMSISETDILYDDRSSIICEVRKNEVLPEEIKKLRCLKTKLYGDTKILVFGK